MTDALVATLAASRLTIVVVVHANHPAELDDAVAVALRRLAAAPALLLNQAVLLAGVNDTAAGLHGLSERLCAARHHVCSVYYLHTAGGVAVRGVPEG